MLIFNCTRAALNFFSYTKLKKKYTPEQARPDFSLQDTGTQDNPLSQWLLQCQKIDGHSVLFACHIQHRFVMIFCNAEKNNWEYFVDLFVKKYIIRIESLLKKYAINTELDQGLKEEITKAFSVPYCCARYCPDTARIINDAIYHFQHGIKSIGFFPSEQNELEFESYVNTMFTNSKTLNDAILPDIELLIDFMVSFTDLHSSMVEKIREDLNEQVQQEGILDIQRFGIGEKRTTAAELLHMINQNLTTNSAKEPLPSNVFSIEQARKNKKK